MCSSYRPNFLLLINIRKLPLSVRPEEIKSSDYTVFLMTINIPGCNANGISFSSRMSNVLTIPAIHSLIKNYLGLAFFSDCETPLLLVLLDHGSSKIQCEPSSLLINWESCKLFRH